MAYTITTPRLGNPSLAATVAAAPTALIQGATSVFPATAIGRTPGPKLGSIVEGYDPVFGNGEFIYLQGVAATVVGSLVTYDAFLNTTTLAPATLGKGPVAVSMSANLLGFYGWYQIQGTAAVKAPNAMVPGAEVFMLAATPGSVDDAAVAGEQVLNATVSTTTGTPSAGLGLIQIERPFLQGQIT
jgi:hypothetical protein